jgi:hypothetical protein
MGMEDVEVPFSLQPFSRSKGTGNRRNGAAEIQRLLPSVRATSRAEPAV